VCAPAGPVDPQSLENGVAELRSLGFEVCPSPGVLERQGFVAGSPETRLRELNDLLASESVRGIVCARGGAGSAQLLKGLDPQFIEAHHKVFVGYSDITWLHLLLNRLGLVTFYGPMAAREFGLASYDPESFLGTLTGDGPHAVHGGLETLRRGSAEGRLLGGCLSLISAAVGTPWTLPEEDETILFLEDVDEAPYRVERMLFQLRESGRLANVRGIVFGEMPGCAPDPSAGYSLQDVILRALDGLDIPVALGLPAGHARSPAVTLPLGARARLVCEDRAELRLLESAVE
jgi:muramoyltetrapeptide carboxypeptidase